MRTFLNCFLVMTVLGFCGSLAAADHHDGYVFRGGKVLMFKEGRETPVTAEVTLRNGARILPDGFIVYKDGRRERWVEERWISFDGEFIVADAGVDAVPVFAEDFEGYYVDAGRVYVVRDRRPVLITTEVVFTDGSRLTPDGFLVVKGGERTRLEAGQRFSREGRRLEVKAAVGVGGRDRNTRTERNERAIDTSRKVEDAAHRTTEQRTTTTEKRETPPAATTPPATTRETPPARTPAAENRERAAEKRESVQERHEEKRDERGNTNTRTEQKTESTEKREERK